MFDLSINYSVLGVIVGVFGILIISSLVVFVLNRRHPDKDYTELTLRVRSWWMMVVIFTIAMTLNRTVSLVFFAFLSFMAFKEYLSIIPTRRADHRVLFWAYLAIPVQYYLAGIQWYGMFVIFIPIYMFLLLPMRMISIGETKGFLKAISTIHWGLMMMVFSISHLAYLLTMPAIENGAGGPGLVLYLVFLTEANDIAQYLWGKMLGKRPIVPQVSPKKTWEGFLGGMATTVALAAGLASLLTPLSLLHAVLTGLIINVAGFIGDVTISALKRDIGIKDSGGMLPGHGGILDRIDSLTFTAPLFFHFIRYFYY